MGLADKVNTGKSAVGNLGAFRTLKNTDLIKPQGSGNQLTASMWAARGGFPFKLPVNKSADIVFLTDVQWIPVHEVAIGERKGAKGKYPLTEMFHSTSILGIDASGTPVKSTRNCLFEQGLGRNPKLILVAKIVDLTAYKLKDGTEVPWTVRTITIPSNSPVIAQLAAASEVTGKDMQYAMFTVSRSGNDKSPKIGDSWTYKTHLTVDDLREEKGLLEAADKIDFERGFPVLEDSDIVSILKTHRKLCDKYAADGKNATMTYDEDGMDKLAGPVMTVAAPSKGVTTLGGTSMPAVTPGALGLRKKAGTGLEDLDDIEVGNPLLVEGDDTEDEPQGL